ncbi:MAG: NADH-quinone oxidoreductase subunit J [Frankiales bacterium]|nr:NADH-quinone oxidoreductase subunit J [Frankiales bacterium]
MSHALVLAAGSVPTHEAVVFWILAPIAVIGALGLVFARSAVHAAVLLALVMLSLAAFYTAEAAPFLAVVQVVVYTGAVLMLFLFVLMLVGVDSADSLVETLRGQRVAGTLVALGFAVLLIVALAGTLGSFHTHGLADAQAEKGNVVAIAELLFSRYVFAFEATSALLITAGLGAMVLAHRERTAPRRTQRERMLERVQRGGAALAPLPGPGVYADHDAVDTPALLPDGSLAVTSVPEYLQIARVETRAEAVDRELEAGA